MRRKITSNDLQPEIGTLPFDDVFVTSVCNVYQKCCDDSTYKFSRMLQASSEFDLIKILSV